MSRTERKNYQPRPIVSIYARHMAFVLSCSALILLGLVLYLKNQIGPYFYSDLYEEISTGYKVKSDAIALALIQRNESRAEAIIADPEFIPEASSKKLVPYSVSNEEAFHKSCSGKFEFQDWSQICKLEDHLQVQIPIRSGDNLLGYLQIEVPASLGTWLPFQRIIQGVGFSLVLLILVTCSLIAIFFRSTVLPVRAAMTKLQSANEESEFKPVLDKLPFQELYQLTSRLSAKSSELSEANVRLERAKHRSQLAEVAAQVSHDIQSPLNTLLSVVNNAASLSQEKQNSMIKSVVLRIEQITADLLKRFKTSDEKTETPLTQVAPIIQSMVEEKLVALRGKSLIRIHADISEAAGLATIRLPSITFSRILSNLLDNSIRAIQDKEAEGTILITARINPSGDHIQIKVQDSGIGMTDEILKKVSTIGGTYNNPAGTGLGLSHAKKTVTDFGGALTIHSQATVGTTVSISVPLSPLNHERQEESREIVLALSQLPKLVLIDDDRMVRDTWKMESEARGFSILTAKNADVIAWETIPKNIPIYIDKNLGGSDGLDVASRVFQSGYSKVFICTAEKKFLAPTFISGVLGKAFPQVLV